MFELLDWATDPTRWLNPPSGGSRLSRIWWTNPTIIFCLLIPLSMAAAIAMPRESYTLYGMPKYVDERHMFMALAAAAAVLVGSRIGWATGEQPKSDLASHLGVLSVVFYGCVALTLFGYAIWLGVAVLRGFNPAMFFKFFMAGRDADFANDLRQRVFETIPGVTTCTNFHVAAVILGCLPGMYEKVHVRLTVFLIIAIAFVRGILLTERLAFIEVAVPSFIVLVRHRLLERRTQAWFHSAVSIFPVVGVSALIVLFGFGEYFRSWRFYEDKFDSIVDYTIWRFSAYYTTCHNNSAMFMERVGSWPLPLTTLQSYWAFPLVENSPLGYKALTGLEPEKEYMSILDRYATAELNNEGGLLQPMIDFGWIGFGLFYLGLGFLCGRAYRSYLAGSLFGMLYLPVVFMHVLETPRYLYMPASRFFPAHVALLATLAYFWLAKRTARASASTTTGAAPDASVAASSGEDPSATNQPPETLSPQAYGIS